MSPEENKATVRRAIEEGWNQGQVAVFDELNAPNFLYHNPGVPDVRTSDDFKRWVTQNHSAFPDLHLTMEDLIADQDQVVVRLTARGTNTGDLRTPVPHPATGRHVTLTGIAIARVEGGPFVEI